MDDLISRQDAIKALCEEPLVWTDSDEELADYNRWKKDVEAIKNVPTAEPRKKGTWILHSYMPHNNYCSNCEKDSPYNRRWNFCPNCGARMEVEE